jgi:RHS repeat-associated protein
MRVEGDPVAANNGVFFFIADHLGSTSVTLNDAGAKIGEMKYTPFGETRYTWGGTPTDRRFTGQRQEDSSLGSLYDFNARMYSPGLGRFISADTIVPDARNPQAFNRYSYTSNNPIRYSDPSGHCEGDKNDPNNPDAGCWAMINQIEGTYSNIHIDSTLWKQEELLQVWEALSGHVFSQDVLGAKAINLFRRNFFHDENDKVGGFTTGDGKGTYDVSIYDFAYKILPDSSGEATKSLFNFQGTVIHELAHVAIYENPYILETYSKRSSLLNHPENLLIGGRMFGEAYPWDKCTGHCDQEEVAIAAATWQLMPQSFDGTFFTDWRKSWIEIFYHPNRKAPGGYGETTITAP